MQPPPTVLIELNSFKLLRPVEQIHPSPLSEFTGTPATETAKIPDVPSLPARLGFSTTLQGGRPENVAFTLTYDISFVTAHPCHPSRKVRFLKSPGSPTLRQIDVDGTQKLEGSRSVYRAGKLRQAPPPPGQGILLTATQDTLCTSITATPSSTSRIFSRSASSRSRTSSTPPGPRSRRPRRARWTTACSSSTASRATPSRSRRRRC